MTSATDGPRRFRIARNWWRALCHLALGGLVLLAASQPAVAQAEPPAGDRRWLVVIDTAGHPIPFASVTLNGGLGTRITDTTGSVHLGKNVKDTVRLTVRRIGYEAFDGK